MRGVPRGHLPQRPRFLPNALIVRAQNQVNHGPQQNQNPHGEIDNDHAPESPPPQAPNEGEADEAVAHNAPAVEVEAVDEQEMLDLQNGF